MVFRKPGNSRDDKSVRSQKRTSNSEDRPKRQASTGAKASSASGQTGRTRTSKKYNGESSGAPGKTSQGRAYKSRETNNEEVSSSFLSRSSSSKSTFSPKKRPYTGRITDNDERPKRSFGGESSGEKKSFIPKSKPYSGRAADTGDKPQRSFKSDDGRKKYNDKPSSYKDFKSSTTAKRTFSDERPARTKSGYDKITPATDVPAKTIRGRKKGAESKDSGLIRLNRYISNAGICSRRKADELIAAGVVAVNGQVVSELGHKVDPYKDEIRYNGELLKREKMVYVLLNKPKDYITTTDDPQERRTVMQLVDKASRERIYPIGRLDRNTTGLLLMTNDGDLADKLSHPRNSIVKLYQVELNKSLTQGDFNKIGFGVELEDGIIKPDSVSYVSGGTKREIGIQIHSGKNRIVRRLFEHLGYEVVKLDRVVYANLTKKDLPRGRWRYLEESEIIQLKHLI